ncbi:hypothetical protein K378_01488 [Streptomyces sp. Amel2xB2]|uniref:hypothetical protein n=1 Tax=Streptomyces sp. Amel2xB2 TaxID=1305829 RepID=UPI000DBF7247|nr:hypothetical protein [Streptomyces sp. Amel2xB2]RAJ70323.1 hypothetical protein K378_01488 [Streptomyces sp. Amel2xB2]
MGMRKAHKIGIAGAAVLGLLVTGYGTAQGVSAAGDGDRSGPHPERAGAQHQPAAAAADDDYQSTLTLGDGRKVHVRLVKGTGVQERHTASGGAGWSKWKTLYKTKTDLCQGVGLEEREGTVSLTADFGLYCYDGEPPTESVAGVGTGDLSKWDIDVTDDFDGWQDTSINDDGSRVTFLYDSDAGLYTLRWEQSEGFSEISRP